MKKRNFIGAILLLFSAGICSGGSSQISYTNTEIGSGQWQYTYDVQNNSLSGGIKEFTVWFDYGSYGNLAIATGNPPSSSWNEVVWQPEPVLQDAGGYDAVIKNLSIGVGEHVNGFAVSFDWLGSGVPGSQYYEIINPVTFQTIDSGWTVPEPATMLLVGLGGLVLWRKRIR